MKILFNNWFYQNDLNVINDWLNQARVSKVSALEGKKAFVKGATEWLCQYQKNEDKAWKMYLLSVPTVNVYSGEFDYKIDEKINIIIEILSEYERNISDKKRYLGVWIGIVATIACCLLSIIVSECSTIKIDETQFNDIKQSIQQIKSLKPIDVPISKDTINIKATDTLKVNITNNRARTKLNNQLK